MSCEVNLDNTDSGLKNQRDMSKNGLGNRYLTAIVTYDLPDRWSKKNFSREAVQA